MITEALIKESIKLIYNIALNKIKSNSLKVESNKKEIENSINHHVRIVKNWSNEITFKDLKASKQTAKVFIPLDLYIYPKRIRFEESETIKMMPLLNIFKKEKKHIAILGQPGAGKTTSMKYLCYSIFYDEDFYPGAFNYPILVKLRELNKPIKGKESAGILIEYLFNLFGLRISDSASGKVSIEQILRTKEVLVLEIVEKLKVLLIIEGFDELSFKSHKEIVRNEISRLANYLENSRMIITSRTADYNITEENIENYEICPLNKNQISSFAIKWLGKKAATKFLSEVKNSPYNDTAIRPLTIAHLCAIFERIGKIPEKPKTVYKKIVNLLLEEWDEQRGIRRKSRYAMFEIDRKFEFLSNLAFNLTLRNGKSIFSKDDLITTYNQIYEDFDLTKGESKKIVNDIESHTGLFVQAGYEFYEFAHKSIQEYLTAEYIVKLPSIPKNKRLITRLPNELAITITISSNPSHYFVELVNNVFDILDLKFDFIQKFINRLLLEKPDFYKNKEVGFAALKLYSIYLKQEKDSEVQLTLFNSDYLVEEFENFINVILKRNSLELVEKFYDLSRDFETMDNTTVFVFKKKILFDKSINASNHILFTNLPELLYCRKSFYSINQNA